LFFPYFFISFFPTEMNFANVFGAVRTPTDR
jgi:hypothetical protein